ncbi:MAG: D-alanyl-D-alanine carboxypeptidase [Hyphomicrobiales bacterium]|nr:D-alanyl-D-alanine carboxypeptidase [Hyphomicrobiales bacterium]
MAALSRAWSTTLLACLACLTLPAAPPAEAGPSLLFDVRDGRVLYAEDADHAWHPASLTKIMTAYVVFEEIRAGRLAMDKRIAVSELAHTMPPSKVGLPVGGELTVEVALQALIVKSANDVAVMLAEAIDGNVEAFAQRMTATARRLGMSRTMFVNPHGLPAKEQVTTARDLAKLSRAVVRDFPQYANLWAQADMQLGRLKLRSHNALLKGYDGTDGIKTGFICDAGFNVVASSTRDGRRLVAVVLGEPTAKDRNLRAAHLLEHGFETDGWSRALSATGATIDTMAVAPDARAEPVSVRASVTSWDCNPQKRRVAKSRKKGAKAVAAAAAAGATKAAAAAGAKAGDGKTVRPQAEPGAKKAGPVTGSVPAPAAAGSTKAASGSAPKAANP